MNLKSKKKGRKKLIYLGTRVCPPVETEIRKRDTHVVHRWYSNARRGTTRRPVEQRERKRNSLPCSPHRDINTELYHIQYRSQLFENVKIILNIHVHLHSV